MEVEKATISFQARSALYKANLKQTLESLGADIRKNLLGHCSGDIVQAAQFYFGFGTKEEGSIEKRLKKIFQVLSSIYCPQRGLLVSKEEAAEMCFCPSAPQQAGCDKCLAPGTSSGALLLRICGFWRTSS